MDARSTRARPVVERKRERTVKGRARSTRKQGKEGNVPFIERLRPRSVGDPSTREDLLIREKKRRGRNALICAAWTRCVV